ncbi:MAG TPA: N-acetyl sugar amidotransferase [Chitinophagaceae bacterium]|nr:N-acetyl sugar amidotransferase [Chitinophagaceae bacterium]
MNFINKPKICTRCIMDSSDPDISFDEKGICNHCHRYDGLINTRVFHGDVAKAQLEKVTEQIKKRAKGKEYDCLIGVSGGVDSTYVAYLVKQLGLRALAVHFDNGWNSELAVSNIEKTLKKLSIDLYTYVIDWEEFKSLQISFLKASTPDGEVPTDHAINALLFQIAAKHNIKYIISGMNFATESMSVPAWAYGHSDWKYIKGVHKKFSAIKLKQYPHFSLLKLFYFTFIKRIQVLAILNYIEYNK